MDQPRASRLVVALIKPFDCHTLPRATGDGTPSSHRVRETTAGGEGAHYGRGEDHAPACGLRTQLDQRLRHAAHSPVLARRPHTIYLYILKDLHYTRGLFPWPWVASRRRHSTVRSPFRNSPACSLTYRGAAPCPPASRNPRYSKRYLRGSRCGKPRARPRQAAPRPALGAPVQTLPRGHGSIPGNARCCEARARRRPRTTPTRCLACRRARRGSPPCVRQHVYGHCCCDDTRQSRPAQQLALPRQFTHPRRASPPTTACSLPLRLRRTARSHAHSAAPETPGYRATTSR